MVNNTGFIHNHVFEQTLQPLSNVEKAELEGDTNPPIANYTQLYPNVLDIAKIRRDHIIHIYHYCRFLSKCEN